MLIVVTSGNLVICEHFQIGDKYKVYNKSAKLVGMLGWRFWFSWIV